MHALDFMRAKGRDRCREIAEAAGTTMGYFEQIAYGHRRPSVEVAKELERASDGEMTAVELLFFDRAAAGLGEPKVTQP